MQPEFNREMHKQIGPKYNPSGSDEPVDSSLLKSDVDGAHMMGNYYSSRPAAIFHNENERQKAAVRSLSVSDVNVDKNSAYALRQTFAESEEADTP